MSPKIRNDELQIGTRKTVITAKSHREAIKTIPEDKRWTCDVCPRTTMHINSRDSHLSGGGHRKNLLKRTQSPSQLRSPIGEWKCDVCVNRPPMHSKDKDAHVRSKGHRANLASSRNEAPPTIISSGPPVNLVIENSGKGSDSKGSDKDRVRDSQMPSADDPGISRSGGSGRRYRGGGGGGGGGGSGRESKGQGRRRHRSMSEDSIRALLHEIDTGFGCNPSGGAYSESDFYFGPGDYDYY